MERFEAASSDASPPQQATASSDHDVSLALAQLQEQIQSQFQEIARLLSPIGEKLDRLAERRSPPQETPAPAAADHLAWQRAILGPDLAAAADLADQRQQLIEGVLRGDRAACGLAGQLLIFQAAPAERLPQLLKDLGEAYYHWEPKLDAGTRVLEEALVQWLQRYCEAAGLANTIELVHPGQRFDASRHHATSRGVEITAVHGWIVLRDNGKVYMKATVSVR